MRDDPSGEISVTCTNSFVPGMSSRVSDCDNKGHDNVTGCNFTCAKEMGLISNLHRLITKRLSSDHTSCFFGSRIALLGSNKLLVPCRPFCQLPKN